MDKDSGIKDDDLYQEINIYLHSLCDDDFRKVMSVFVRENYLSEMAIKKGYGIEDVASFIRWLDLSFNIQM